MKISIPIPMQIPTLELCAHCFGTGKLLAMQMAVTYDGGTVRYKDKPVKCEKCKGSGKIKR